MVIICWCRPVRAPASRWATWPRRWLNLVQAPDDRIVVATATLALQAQLARKDIPTALAACEQVTGRSVKHAILKGRTNYACLYRVRDGLGLEQESLIGGPELVEALTASAPDASSKVGAEVVALREWVETEARAKGLADRDDAPSHGNQSWTQVSIPVRECLGVQRCPYGGECFVERSRDRARAAQLVVTNHALLAIDAMRHGATRARRGDHRRNPPGWSAASPGPRRTNSSPQTIEQVAALPALARRRPRPGLSRLRRHPQDGIGRRPARSCRGPDGGLGVAPPAGS